MAQARFIFGLEPLLEIRRRAEKEEQRKVAVIQQEINGLIGKVREAESAIVEQNRRLSAERLTGRLDLNYIATEKRYVGTLHVMIVQTLQKLAVEERKMTVAKGVLLEAAQARKVIEKLREKEFERWREEQNRKEAAETDEIGTQLALRQRNEAAEDEMENEEGLFEEVKVNMGVGGDSGMVI